MPNTDTLKRQDFLDAIREFRLIDDTFFNSCFEGQPECMELLLRIVLRKPKLRVAEMYTQKEVPNIYGRSVRFDVFAKDADGTEYNVEVQRSDDGADPKRARFNASLMDTKSVEKGTKWKDFPPTIIIFITEHDTIGGEKPIYHVKRTIEELGHKRFEDESEIIYVNGEVHDESSLGYLMHDFFCTNPADMHYHLLAERMKYFKTNEHGVSEMCKIMESIEKRGYSKGADEKAASIIRNLLKTNMSHAEIAKNTETSIEEVERIASESQKAC